MSVAAGIDTVICRVSTLDAIRKESGGFVKNAVHPDEAKRSEAISHPHRRAQFLAGRWLTRQLLCEALGAPHEIWHITSDAASKPRLVGCDDIHFSITHSKDLIACAIGPSSVGLDIERIDPSREVTELADMIDATASIEHEAGRTDIDRFSIAWTLKEACIKKTAEPFDIGIMRRIRLALSAPEQANVANWIDPGGFALSLATDQVYLAHLRWLSPAQMPLATYYRLLAT